jgi:hypothetical protein
VVDRDGGGAVDMLGDPAVVSHGGRDGEGGGTDGFAAPGRPPVGFGLAEVRLGAFPLNRTRPGGAEVVCAAGAASPAARTIRSRSVAVVAAGLVGARRRVGETGLASLASRPQVTQTDASASLFL